MPKIKEVNFAYLLAGLLLVLVAGPTSDELLGEMKGIYTQIVFTSVLIVGVWSLLDSRPLFVTGVVLAVASLVTVVLEYVNPSPANQLAGLLIVLLFCILSLGFAFRHIVFGYEINLNRLTGAICVYLLLGMTWGLIYTLVDWFLPGSFSGVDTSRHLDQDAWHLMYFSFVTLTTLGFGDITPIAPLARVLTYLEAVIGTFYMAMLVGTLVGLMLRKRREID